MCFPEEDDKRKTKTVVIEEFLGVPKRLAPLFLAFMLDGIATGLLIPVMPFYFMELGADAFQLSLVISATYVAQMIGCIIVGQLNDKYGRRPHILACLFTSCASLLLVSRSTTLIEVALSRILSVMNKIWLICKMYIFYILILELFFRGFVVG